MFPRVAKVEKHRSKQEECYEIKTYWTQKFDFYPLTLGLFSVGSIVNFDFTILNECILHQLLTRLIRSYMKYGIIPNPHISNMDP